MTRPLYNMSKATSFAATATNINSIVLPQDNQRVAVRIVNLSNTEPVYLQYRDKSRFPDVTTTPFSNGIGDAIMPGRELVITKDYFTYNEIWIHAVTGPVSVSITRWG